MHPTPIMLMDGQGGIGGIWFENVKVAMTTTTATSDPSSALQPFLSYNRWACAPGAACPNATGDIRGDIEVEWQTSAEQCTPRLLTEGIELPANGSVFGHQLMKNVSVRCTKHDR